MLCICRAWKGTAHYELLPSSKKADSDLHCQQLTGLEQTIEKNQPDLLNRKGVVFCHKSSRPHPFLAIRQKSRKDFDGKFQYIHSLNSPDLVLADYRLLWSSQNSLNVVQLVQKPQTFYGDRFALFFRIIVEVYLPKMTSISFKRIATLF